MKDMLNELMDVSPSELDVEPTEKREVTPVLGTNTADLKENIVEEAAKHIFDTLPRINTIVSTMDRLALMKVFKASVAFPFIEKMPKIKKGMEQELFLLTLSVLNAKVTVINSVSKETIENEITKNAIEEMAKGETNVRNKNEVA